MRTAYTAIPLSGGLVRVIKKSAWSGKLNQMDLPVTLNELRRHAEGEHAQNVWPQLTLEQREFLISGCVGEEWDAMFPRADD